VTRRLPSQPPELPGYEYVKILGSGGFSDVFLYNQRLPRRKVAVKVLLTEQLNPQTRSRFVDEANVMAQLSAHPYIVTIYHADVASDDRPYFVMEYCSGPSLAERYKREPFSVADALRTGVRLSSAIATAHSAGILHRDIKPANVLTNDFGWPALTDFGISSTLEDELPVHTTTTAARLREEAGGNTGTSEQQSVGMSVPWSPPEMFEDDPQADVRSDVFSLAATIHTLLAGRTPFEVPGKPNGTLDLIGRIERGAITPIGRDDVPRSLAVILQKGMASKRTNRFDSAVDFARGLQRVELELGYSPTNIEVPNLGVSRVERAESESSDDATRVRSVATIAAQPPPAPLPSTVPDADSTRIRPAVTNIAATQNAEEHTVLRPAAAAASASTASQEAAEVVAPRRRWPIITVAAACAVVIGCGIAAAMIVPQISPDPDRQSGVPGAPGNDDGVIRVASVPDATAGDVTRSPDGTSVTFTWKNPKPKAGDTYQWTQDGTTKPPTPTTKNQAVVDALAPGASVCINVVIIRDGRTSANPLKECTS
jgi:serine/threonine protein kinase